jgi:AmmeMemoRadiSam system protein A
MTQRLTAVERQMLLTLARRSIEHFLRDGSRVELPKYEGVLAEPCGAFVTLHKRGQLRGCIGHMVGYAPLAETVREMAIAAATEDPRFHRVRVEELPDLDIEISVLSPMRRITSANEIEVGTHGILMRRGVYQGVLLPQVATEYGWDRETFLANTCLKAGLPTEAWKDPETIIEIFSAEVFGEKERA